MLLNKWVKSEFVGYSPFHRALEQWHLEITRILEDWLHDRADGQRSNTEDTNDRPNSSELCSITAIDNQIQLVAFDLEIKRLVEGDSPDHVLQKLLEVSLSVPAIQHCLHSISPLSSIRGMLLSMNSEKAIIISLQAWSNCTSWKNIENRKETQQENAERSDEKSGLDSRKMQISRHS